MPALRRFRRSVVVVAVLLLAVQCDNPADLDRPISSIVIVPDSVTFTAIGATRGLEAIARDADGKLVPDLQLLWMTTDPSVARVTASGLVTAAGNGTADVQAHTANVVGAARVTVSQRATAIQVDPADLVFTALGDTARVVAIVQDSLGHGMPGAPCVWSSSDSSVVTVDAGGLVEAEANGYAAVVAMTNGLADTAKISVDQLPVAVTVTPDTLFMWVAHYSAPNPTRDTAWLSAEVYDANGYRVESGFTFQWRTWTTYLRPVVTVGNGLVTAIGEGTAWVVASAVGAADSAYVQVAMLPPPFPPVPPANRR